MTAQEIINEYNLLQDKALTVANLYRYFFSKDTSGVSIDKPAKDFTKFSLESDYMEYKPGFFIVSYEYNDSCNCHPEYRYWEEKLPVEWLDLHGLELEEAIQKFINQKIEDRQKEIEAAKKKEEQEKKKKLKDQEQEERKTLERLKKKYDH